MKLAVSFLPRIRRIEVGWVVRQGRLRQAVESGDDFRFPFGISTRYCRGDHEDFQLLPCPGEIFKLLEGNGRDREALLAFAHHEAVAFQAHQRLANRAYTDPIVSVFGVLPISGVRPASGARPELRDLEWM